MEREVAATEGESEWSELPIHSAAAHGAALRWRLPRVASELAGAETTMADCHDKLAAPRLRSGTYDGGLRGHWA